MSSEKKILQTIMALLKQPRSYVAISEAWARDRAYYQTKGEYMGRILGLVELEMLPATYKREELDQMSVEALEQLWEELINQ